jgi:predicted AAA+ superfamily ATPase
VITGSAIPLAEKGQESGVGRWHTIKVATLSFYEFLQIKKLKLPELPRFSSLLAFFDLKENEFTDLSVRAAPLLSHFQDYLLRGGFPQTALVENVITAQKLLREDIVDKVLKRDMTALFGVRRVLELEQLFLYLCLHDGGLLDIPDVCNNLQLKKPTVNNFIDLLEATHLIYKLPPYGYGKEILRARFKVYLADPAIAPSVLLKGRSLLEDSTRLGVAVETAFFRHVYARFYKQSIGFTYWRRKQNHEVDLVAEIEGKIVPFEVKYRHPAGRSGDLKGLHELLAKKQVDRGYVISKDIEDFGVMTLPVKTKSGDKAKILKLPAVLACYWLGQSEVDN